MQCPLIESKHKADVFHFSLYLHPFIGSNHKMEFLYLSCHSRHHFTHYNALITNRLCETLKVTANEKQKKYGNRVNIKTASWLDVLDELHIWMYCIFGCVGYDRVRDKDKARI